MSSEQPQTWLITMTEESSGDLYDNISKLRGDTRNVNPFFHQEGFRGKFELIIEGKSEQDIDVLRHKIRQLKLRILEGEEKKRAEEYRVKMPREE